MSQEHTVEDEKYQPIETVQGVSHTYTMPDGLTDLQKEGIARVVSEAYRHGKKDAEIALHHSHTEEVKGDRPSFECNDCSFGKPCLSHTEEVEQARGEEKQAWMNGERCSSCGVERKADSLSDMCLTCFEEA